MRIWKLVLLAAIILGALAAGITYHYVRKVAGPSSRAMAPGPARIVAAKQVIPAYTVITQDMVYLKVIPGDAVGPDAITRLEDAVGSIAKQEIARGQELLRSMVLNGREEGGLAFLIPPGKRAVTIQVNEIIGVGGFIKPGDRVDVLGAFRSEESSVDMSMTVLQNVEVLAVAQEMEEKERNKARVATSVTLAVTQKEAERLILAEELGNLRLALCPFPRGASSGTSSRASSASGNLIPGNSSSGVSRVTALEILGKPATTGGISRPAANAAATPKNYGGPVVSQSKGPWKPEVSGKPEVIEVIRGIERSYVTLDGGGGR
ncbi:MAG TPA: Flp pilus assembly protein CpaB [Firmicutes bacterium]|nr:Flp pilus assembly protein CpaB [Bacillota bacterium]